MIYSWTFNISLTQFILSVILIVAIIAQIGILLYTKGYMAGYKKYLKDDEKILNLKNDEELLKRVKMLT